MTDASSAPPLYTPTPDRVDSARMTAFARAVEQRHDVSLASYDDLWRWSVDHLEEFWAMVWDYFEIGTHGGYDAVLTDASMPGARWFPGAQLNYAERILSQGDPDAVAVIATDEEGRERTWTRTELRAEAGALAATLQRNGVSRGDVVAAYLPNIGQTIASFLAVVSIGAIWTSVGQDYAPQAAVDRFAQLEPVALIAADGYCWNGSRRDRSEASEELRAALPTVRTAILVETNEPGPDREPWQRYSQAIAEPADLVPVPLAFDAPLWVLFSSGTTGVPKGLVHSHGGVLIEAVKKMALHSDLGAADRFFWYTSPSWVMWNTLLHGMAVGASIVCYDGAPTHPSPDRLWEVVETHRVTFFGASPGYLQACENDDLHPARDHDLSALVAMGSTGAPLPAHSFRWVLREVGQIPLWSLSGGTDVATAFVSGAPTVPVWAGEISTRCLGIAVESWDDDGKPLIGQVGELVITKPMPSMPLRLWGDQDGERYREAYFSTFPGVWRQGDWITVTERGSVVIHGRSDATLNRHGVRMGSADIYAAVEQHPQVVEALVVGCEQADGGYWMPLFVVLGEGIELSEDLVTELKNEIRRTASPRHVPDEIIQVRGIPHTRTGKKLEVPVKRLLQGAPVDRVAQRQAIDDPDLLEEFAALRPDAGRVLP